MNMGKIIAGVVFVIAVVAFFSIFIVKEVNQAIVLQLVIQKELFQNQD